MWFLRLFHAPAYCGVPVSPYVPFGVSAMNGRVARLLVLLLAWGIVLAQAAGASCPADTSAGLEGEGFVKRLPAGCTEAEREAEAVGAMAILEALEKGKRVELAGVIVRGDLTLDRLPVSKVAALDRPTGERQDQDRLPEVRRIRGALIISNSVVEGSVRHGSERGRLEFEGPVDFHGTTFLEGVDLSRARFLGPVELSGATFRKEAYFIQGLFAQAVRCKETTFGVHTRFHQATFQGPVDCTGALFDGMAEFLEVTFEQPALFERARFGSGTGFSGSRFMRQVSFGEAIFSRSTFFTFSVFEEAALFAGAFFLGPADFSDAVFREPDDLAKARFDSPPVLARAKRNVRESSAGSFDSPLGRYTVTVVCLVAAAVLLAYVWKA